MTTTTKVRATAGPSSYYLLCTVRRMKGGGRGRISFLLPLVFQISAYSHPNDTRHLQHINTSCVANANT